MSYLSSAVLIELNSLGNDASVCNICSFPLKLFTETAEADSSSNEFQRLITRSVKGATENARHEFAATTCKGGKCKT